MKTGIELIADERKRQIEEEEWSAEHDDEHTDQSLALAAICYATPVQLYCIDKALSGLSFIDPWPDSWDVRWDKRLDYGDPKEEEEFPDPSTYTDSERLDLLIKAGALIAAEIDRLQRAQGED